LQFFRERCGLDNDSRIWAKSSIMWTSPLAPCLVRQGLIPPLALSNKSNVCGGPARVQTRAGSSSTKISCALAISRNQDPELVRVDKTMGKNETDQQVQDEQHIRKLIAALKGSAMAAAWWEFKKGSVTGSGSRIEQDAAKDGQAVSRSD
jgi:hypothetical protein